jgi:hypothetical protein
MPNWFAPHLHPHLALFCSACTTDKAISLHPLAHTILRLQTSASTAPHIATDAHMVNFNRLSNRDVAYLYLLWSRVVLGTSRPNSDCMRSLLFHDVTILARRKFRLNSEYVTKCLSCMINSLTWLYQAAIVDLVATWLFQYQHYTNDIALTSNRLYRHQSQLH